MIDRTFYNKDSEEISIDDITIGTIFTAKDVDGKYITDTDGNNLFEAVKDPEWDYIMGMCVDCKPLGVMED